MDAVNYISLNNGLKTRILDSGGEKAPLVLIHGLANSIEIWSRVLPQLTRNFRVLTFDLPGFGLADRPEAEYDSEFFVEQLRVFLDTLGLDRAHLLGNSLGGSIVVRFSEHHQDRVGRTVIAAPGGFGRETNLLMRLPALPVVGYALGRPTWLNNELTLRLVMHDRSNITPALRKLTNRYAAIEGSHRAFALTLTAGVGVFGVKDREHFAKLARKLDRPTLVVWGKQDRVFPPCQSDAAMNLLPNGTRVLLDQCGHYPQWEQPDAFVAAVERHLLSNKHGAETS